MKILYAVAASFAAASAAAYFFFIIASNPFSLPSAFFMSAGTDATSFGSCFLKSSVNSFSIWSFDLAAAGGVFVVLLRLALAVAAVGDDEVDVDEGFPVGTGDFLNPGFADGGTGDFLAVSGVDAGEVAEVGFEVVDSPPPLAAAFAAASFFLRRFK